MYTAVIRRVYLNLTSPTAAMSSSLLWLYLVILLQIIYMYHLTTSSLPAVLLRGSLSEAVEKSIN